MALPPNSSPASVAPVSLNDQADVSPPAPPVVPATAAPPLQLRPFPGVNSPPPDVSPPPSDSPPPPRATPPEKSPPSHQQTPPPPLPRQMPPPLSSPTNSSTPETTSQLPPGPEQNLQRSTDTSSTGRVNGSPDGSGGKSNNGSVAAIALVVGFVTLGFLIMGVWFKRRHKRRNGRSHVYIMPSPSNSSQKSDSLFLRSQPSTHQLAGSPSVSNSIYSPENGGVGNTSAWFMYEELSDATDGFS